MFRFLGQGLVKWFVIIGSYCYFWLLTQSAEGKTGTPPNVVTLQRSCIIPGLWNQVQTNSVVLIVLVIILNNTYLNVSDGSSAAILSSGFWLCRRRYRCCQKLTHLRLSELKLGCWCEQLFLLNRSKDILAANFRTLRQTTTTTSTFK